MKTFTYWAFLCVLLLSLSGTATARQPNVIIVYTDDQGTVDAGCYGTKDIQTPNIDRLSTTGVRFTQFYAPAPVCSPSRAGLLTGKYSRGKRPEHGRLVDNEMYGVRYGDTSVFDVAERFTEFAAARGLHPVALAIAWVSGHPAVTSTLLGARNPGQLRVALSAAEIAMTNDLREAVSALSATPPPATDRNEEATAHNYGSR